MVLVRTQVLHFPSLIKSSSNPLTWLSLLAIVYRKHIWCKNDWSWRNHRSEQVYQKILHVFNLRHLLKGILGASIELVSILTYSSWVWAVISYSDASVWVAYSDARLHLVTQGPPDPAWHFMHELPFSNVAHFVLLLSFLFFSLFSFLPQVSWLPVLCWPC